MHGYTYSDLLQVLKGEQLSTLAFYSNRITFTACIFKYSFYFFIFASSSSSSSLSISASGASKVAAPASKGHVTHTARGVRGRLQVQGHWTTSTQGQMDQGRSTNENEEK